MKYLKGCFIPILFLVATTLLVVWITGYDENDDTTESLDSWSEFFAALLFFPILYLLLRLTGVLKNDDLLK